jgi:transcriptional regulator with XRE-family HTH domain
MSTAALSPRWQTKFGRFVRTYGAARLARKLEVDPAAIYQWVRGQTSPRAPKARTIVILASEITRLSLDDIYSQYELHQAAESQDAC